VDRIRASLASVRRFIDEAWSELKKVSWPTLLTTRNLTVLVFAVSLAIGIFITVFDTIFLEAVKFLSTSG
jgi:preprotein translocase SecE subunit